MFITLTFRQLRQRWLVSFLLWGALTTLVSLFVYLQNTSRFANRSMQLITKKLGHNLFIISRNTPPLQFHTCGDHQRLFPESVAERIARNLHLRSKYYVATLQKHVNINNRGLILTGVRLIKRGDETQEKGHLIEDVPAGHVRLGAAAAQDFNLQPGGKLELADQTFTVDEILPANGSIDDHRAYINLRDAQKLMGVPGMINLVMAFICLHGNMGMEQMDRQIQAAYARLYPEVRPITRLDIARGRYFARRTTAKYLRYLLLLGLAVTIAVIVITGLQEVDERRGEFGIMVAMGAGYSYILALYFFKMLILCAMAAVAGFLLGSEIAVWFTRPFLVTNTQAVAFVWEDLPFVLALTCAVGLAAEALPMIKLITRDPCEILMET